MPHLLVISCCALAAIGSFLFGYDTGIVSSVLAQPDFGTLGNGTKLSDTETGGIVSSFTGGAIIGTLAIASVADSFGRRAAICLGALFACLGGALQCGAINVSMMVIGRIFAGLGVGIMSPTIPNFCMEVAPPHMRGMLGGMQQWMLGLGIVTSQWVGYACSLKGGSFSWRFPLGVQAVPALILACSIFLIPESPRNLMERNQVRSAEDALSKYRLARDNTNLRHVQDELHQIQMAVQGDRAASQTSGWHMLYQDPTTRKALLLACGIQLFTQTSGVNVIGYYGPQIYARLGYTGKTSLLIQGIYGALALLWNTVCLAVVDRVGRRKLLLPSMIGMGIALCVEATLVRYFDPQTTVNTNALRASVAMNFVFSIFFTSLGTISWIFAGEVFSNHMRARGTSVSTFVNWGANLIFAQCSPLALTRIGANYLYIFTAFNWTAAIIIWVYYPETQKKLTLETVPEIVAHRVDVSDDLVEDGGQEIGKIMA